MPARSFPRDIPPLRGFSLGLVYLTWSFPLGSWVGRIPQIKESLGANDARWGLASTIATCGEIVGLAIIVVLIGRTSTRTTTIVTAGVVLAMGPLVALSPTLPTLVASLTLWMIASKILGTTSGALILVYQRDLGRIIFGRFDALYSIGMLLGGALSWAAIRQDIPASHQFAITNSMLAITLLISYRALPDEEAPTTESEPLRRRLRSRFTGPLLLLGGLSLLASFIDSAAAQWAGIYLSRAAGGDPALGSLGYVLVMATKSVCLLFIGTISAHIGWRAVTLTSVAVTTLALLLGVGSGLLVPGVIALLVLGAGTAFFGPMVNTLGSAQPGVTDGEARTMLEMGELPAYVMTPVLVGMLASVLDVRWAFLMMTGLPLLVCGALFLAPGTRRLLTAHGTAYERGSSTS
ncbi:MFS transporter [Brachybacterium paraconglomeratum]